MVLAWYFTRGEEEVAVFEPQRVTATTGQLTTTIELSGSAQAARTSQLSFAAGGEVGAIEVRVGDQVAAGELLARLDASAARRQLESTQIQLRLAQLRLEDLLEKPAASSIAASERALATAEASLLSARTALDEIGDPPDEGAVASAEQAVANAQTQVSNAAQALVELTDEASASVVARATQAVANAALQLSTAEQSLGDLTDEPSSSAIANAEQAVANARAGVSRAEDALSALTSEPSAAEISSAEQAVASTASQLLSAEQALASLSEEPSVAELETARSNAVQARNPVSTAEAALESAVERLERAHEDFCDDIVVLPEICDDAAPLPESEIELLETKTENSGATLERRARALIDAQAAWERAVNTHEAALSTLMAAEARLNELINPDPVVVQQASEALAAVQASHAAAKARLDDLNTPATEAEIFQAEQTLAAATAGLAAAEANLSQLLKPADEAEVFRAEQAVEAAEAGLIAAQEELSALLGDADPDDVYQAQQSLIGAQANRVAAESRLAELLAPASEDDILEARLTVASAESSLEEAQARHDELLAGPNANELGQMHENVLLAGISVEQALANLDDLIITAPFDGVVELINVEPGDRIGAGATALVLSTADQIIVALTVTEAEIFELEEQQVGVAAFDAIEGAQYPLRISTISRVPNIEQGVVTYEVEARLLSPSEIQSVRIELQALGVAVPEQAAERDQAGQAGARGGGAVANPQEAGRFQAWLQSLDLPEGVTVLNVVQAIANDEPLPDGVELPEGFAITDEQRAQLRAVLARFTGGGEGATGTAAVGDDRQLPIEGMSATIVLLTAVRDEAVLLSASAVRQIDGAFFVAVPTQTGGWERIEVQIGDSDGTNVEILSGLAAGDVVLVGVDSEGIAYSATQLPVGGAAGGFGSGGAGPPRGGGGGS